MVGAPRTPQADGHHKRFDTFRFTADADLADDSGLWPTSFAVTELSDEAATTITNLVRKAVS
ncbi:hypothetical protein [Nonomuraea sp. NPDC003214]